jgi:hypothetical protein
MQLISPPLASFLAALGLRAEAVETADRLTISARVDGQAVRHLDYGVVERLLASYGDTITAEFKYEDLSQLTIKSALTADVFRQEQADFESGSSYELGLRIDKRALLDQVLGPEAARGSVQYFFAASVESLLARGLDQLETAIWADATEPRRLLVGDTELHRSGPAFQIVGGSYLAQELPALDPLPERTRASIERMRSDREEQISWDYPWVQRLTPLQLQLDGESGGSDLEKLFAAGYIQLCLLYTCDRARRRRHAAGQWEAWPEYQGGQVTVRVPLREAQPIAAPVTGAVVAGFAGLVDWCYRLRDEGTTRDWAPDRLRFTQVRIAQVLEPVPEADRLASLVGQVTDIVAALDDQWRAFIEDRFTQYLDKERQLETAVNEVVITFGNKTTELTKGLSDTLLAAVAALIGSAIAAAFKTPFNAPLFRVGVLAYAGYALIFPGLYGLGSQAGQFLQIGQTFDHEQTRFNTLLGRERTDKIVDGRPEQARRRYWKWFGLTVFGYVIAIGGAIAAAVLIPSIIR